MEFRREVWPECVNKRVCCWYAGLATVWEVEETSGENCSLFPFSEYVLHSWKGLMLTEKKESDFPTGAM